MILDADLAALGTHAVAGPLDFAKALPAFGLNRSAVAFADQMIRFKTNDGSRRILVQIVLDQLGDQIVAVEVKKVVPETGYPVGLGDELSGGPAVQVAVIFRIHTEGYWHATTPGWESGELCKRSFDAERNASLRSTLVTLHPAHYSRSMRHPPPTAAAS